MTMICLVRHGETDWNAQGKIQGRTDIPLNELGKQQAKECRDFLSQSNWDVIISSPLKRAKQTAEIINEGLHIPLIEMEEFQERSFGDAEGMPLDERIRKFPDRNYPNQEERSDLQARLLKGIKQIHSTYRDKKVLLVAHGAVINAILSMFSKGEIGSGKTSLINACISTVQFLEDKWNIIDYNQVSHLTKYTERERL